jgi:hypothetical protein
LQDIAEQQEYDVVDRKLIQGLFDKKIKNNRKKDELCLESLDGIEFDENGNVLPNKNIFTHDGASFNDNDGTGN